MSLVRRSQGSSCSVISFRAAVVCLAALGMLWMRTRQPVFRFTSGISSVSSQPAHDHKPLFDHEDAQCLTLLGTPFPVAPPLVTLHLSYSAKSVGEFTADGWHYNRPPPIS
jgi:hypothetical protein